MAIPGVHALLTNIVLAWSTQCMGAIVGRLREGGRQIDDDWLRRLGPAHFGHIKFRGIPKFNLETYADALRQGAASKQAASP